MKGAHQEENTKRSGREDTRKTQDDDGTSITRDKLAPAANEHLKPDETRLGLLSKALLLSWCLSPL